MPTAACFLFLCCCCCCSHSFLLSLSQAVFAIIPYCYNGRSYLVRPFPTKITRWASNPKAGTCTKYNVSAKPGTWYTWYVQNTAQSRPTGILKIYIYANGQQHPRRNNSQRPPVISQSVSQSDHGLIMSGTGTKTHSIVICNWALAALAALAKTRATKGHRVAH